MLLIVHMGEEVKHGPTDGVAVFAPVIASIIILIGSNGLIRLLTFITYAKYFDFYSAAESHSSVLFKLFF